MPLFKSTIGDENVLWDLECLLACKLTTQAEWSNLKDPWVFAMRACVRAFVRLTTRPDGRGTWRKSQLTFIATGIQWRIEDLSKRIETPSARPPTQVNFLESESISSESDRSCASATVTAVCQCQCKRVSHDQREEARTEACPVY
jgi:hypothetical protein